MVVKRSKKKVNIFQRINSSIGKDRTILLISLGFSMVFWLFVKLSKSYFSEIVLPIKWELPEDKAFSTIPPSSVEVEIEGSGWDLLSQYFLKKPDSLRFNVAELPARMVDRTQIKSKIKKHLSSAIEIKEINHDFVQLEFENKITKKIPVFADLTIKFSQNHYYKEPLTISPDSVLVSGPYSYVNSLDSVYTVQKTFENLKNSVAEKIAVSNPHESILTITPPGVNLIIPVEQITEKTYFVPVKVINNRDSIHIFPEKVKVTCVVGLSKFQSISPADFEVVADMKNVNIKDTSNFVRYHLVKQPNNVISTHYSPKTGDFIIVK